MANNLTRLRARIETLRLAQTYAIASTIGLKNGFNEEDLYANLTWLCQTQIEDKIFTFKSKETPPNLFLYDVRRREVITHNLYCS
jgi:hypothetical protein